MYGNLTCMNTIVFWCSKYDVEKSSALILIEKEYLIVC